LSLPVRDDSDTGLLHLTDKADGDAVRRHYLHARFNALERCMSIVAHPAEFSRFRRAPPEQRLGRLFEPLSLGLWKVQPELIVIQGMRKAYTKLLSIRPDYLAKSLCSAAPKRNGGADLWWFARIACEARPADVPNSDWNGLAINDDFCCEQNLDANARAVANVTRHAEALLGR
jgi:hypothetical protein